MTGPLHVLLASASLDFGGAESYTVQLARSLADRGDRVTVAYSRHSQNPLLTQLDPRVGRLELPFRTAQSSRLNHIRNMLLSVPVLARFCLGERVNIVHTVLPAVGLAAWVAARVTGRPAVHMPMCVSAVSPRTQRLYRARTTRVLLNRYLALSDYISYDLVENVGVPASVVRVCRLGVDIGRFSPRTPANGRAIVPRMPGEVLVGVCARLEPDKDVERVIRAFALVDPALRARLALVGDGPQRSELEALAGELGVADRVHFVGTRSDVNDVIPQFDVGLQTTRGPNLGLVTLEMLASGVPVVIAARDAEEVRMAEDTLLGGGGGLVADAAPAALAAALERLLRAPEAVRVVNRQRARATAETHYDWESHVDRVRRAYLEVASET